MSDERTIELTAGEAYRIRDAQHHVENAERTLAEAKEHHRAALGNALGVLSKVLESHEIPPEAANSKWRIEVDEDRVLLVAPEEPAPPDKPAD